MNYSRTIRLLAIMGIIATVLAFALIMGAIFLIERNRAHQQQDQQIEKALNDTLRIPAAGERRAGK